MSYQVIARKYRPQRFADVVGQEHVTQTLTNAVLQKRIAHAYLFCGPRGTGKTTIARIFAKCLNCSQGPKVDFAEDDPRCLEITEGRALDVLEIDGASNNGVEQVRELRETARYAPAAARFKIYIIDEVHMLSTAAFNALLKTLEEPPAHVKFMFATTDPEKVLPTILSRCQRFDLRRIPSALIVRHLAKIAGAEGVRIDDAALHAIARGADGGMRDAESTLDQLISFCGQDIGETDVLSMFGLTARTQVLALTGALLEGDAAQALRDLEELARNGKDLGRLLADLLNHFRNLLIFQVSRGDLGLLEVSEAEVAALREQAPRVTTEALTRVLEVLTDAEGRLRDAVSKKILLEVTLLKAIQVRQALSLDAVLRHLTQLRQAGLSFAAAAPAVATAGSESAVAGMPAEAPAPSGPVALPQVAPAASATAAAPGPPPAPLTMAENTPPSAAGDRGELDKLWAQLLEAVGRVSPFTRSYLLKAFPVSFERGHLTVGFDPEFADQLPLVDNPKNQALLQTKLRELGLPATQIKFIQAEPPAAAKQESEAPPQAVEAPPTPPAPADSAPAPKPAKPRGQRLDPAEFKNDPLIKEALELFKGQIVEVRG
jgi:DNA polymerase-3 subunit gamma/tau